jgi:hypothetical protein
VKKSFNIQELLHCKSKHHGTKAHAALLVESFLKRPRTQSEASRFGGSHKYKRNKTNYLPSFIDRSQDTPLPEKVGKK